MRQRRWLPWWQHYSIGGSSGSGGGGRFWLHVRAWARLAIAQRKGDSETSEAVVENSGLTTHAKESLLYARALERPVAVGEIWNAADTEASQSADCA